MVEGHNSSRIHASKAIQYQHRSLLIPLPHIPGSPLCSVTALRHHLRLNSGSPTAPLPLFFVPPLSSYFPLPIAISAFFISKVISAIGLVPANYSSHSFRLGGASFAFR